MEDTLQDELKVQSNGNLLKRAVERLCITSYKMTVYMTFLLPP